MDKLRQQLRKYFIMGSQNCNRPPEDILLEAAKEGITAFQYREKGPGSLTGAEKIKLGERLRTICRAYHILFFINDDVELVEVLDADGIHVGQDDMDAAELRRQFPNKIIGLSVSNQNEVNNSPITAVDYLGAGPIYGTYTKTDAKAPVGVNWMKELRAQFPSLPIVGIGGIQPMNSHHVIEAGADGVSVISAITEAPHIHKVVAAL